MVNLPGVCTNLSSLHPWGKLTLLIPKACPLLLRGGAPCTPFSPLQNDDLLDFVQATTAVVGSWIPRPVMPSRPRSPCSLVLPIFPPPLFLSSLWTLWRWCDTDGPLWLSVPLTHSLHLDQLWASVIPTVHCRKKPLWWGQSCTSPPVES